METNSSQEIFNILVVDDDPTFRQGLQVSLKTSGYSAHMARSGEEALRHVRQQPIDLVLLDVNMPGIGGIEACRRIRMHSFTVVRSCGRITQTRGKRMHGREPCQPGSNTRSAQQSL